MNGPAKNRVALVATKVILTAVFLALGALYVSLNWDELVALDWPSGFAVAVVAFAFMLNVLLRATYNMLISRELGARLTLMESFMLSSVVAAGNFVLPVKAGAGIRAMYMKKVHDFPISYFASGSLIFVLVTIFFVSFAAICLLFVIWFDRGYFRIDLSLLFPTILLVMVAGLLSLRGKGKFDVESKQSWWSMFRGSLFAILGHRKLVVAALAIVCFVFLSASIAWTIALRDYAADISVAEAFLLSTSQMISGLITLTPGSAGFQELAGLYVGRSFAATTMEMFAVLIWVRIVRTIVAIILAVPSALVLKDKLAGLAASQLPATNPVRGPES